MHCWRAHRRLPYLLHFRYHLHELRRRGIAQRGHSTVYRVVLVPQPRIALPAAGRQREQISRPVRVSALSWQKGTKGAALKPHVDAMPAFNR